MQPKIVIIAGANGAGKTTFARRLLQDEHPECVFLNADEIQRQDMAFGSPAAAGREMLRRLRELESRVESVAIETTLSSRLHLRRIPDWKASGYVVWLYFLEVESADFSVARVAHRVSTGGHGIPDADIRRRYLRGLALLTDYQAAVDAWYHFHVGTKGFSLVGSKAP